MQDAPSDRDALQALLDFHVEAGVDLALDETPHNRFAEPKAEPARAKAPAPKAEAPRSETPPPRTLPKAAASAPEEVASLAREQARHAQSLEELEAILAGSTAAP
jgi:DNA polymerase